MTKGIIFKHAYGHHKGNHAAATLAPNFNSAMLSQSQFVSLWSYCYHVYQASAVSPLSNDLHHPSIIKVLSKVIHTINFPMRVSLIQLIL